MPVSDVTLWWSLRESFRAYVASLADGQEVVGGGAGIAGDGRFEMKGTSQPDAPVGADAADAGVDSVLAFEGTVGFSGYFGMLSVSISAPWVGLRNDGSGVVSILSQRDPRYPGRRVTIAEFGEVVRAPQELTVPRPTLTSAGVALLGDVYKVGDLLDPIEIRGAGVSPSP
ncbi:HtaA domain-containing protein [Georgenia sp. AZ-5]|uniref:HtaA domain-containing protein n=1 Tax=Georgenia sp. AZ-5 TaxID=3367526 RepID=UPI003754FBAD